MSVTSPRRAVAVALAALLCALLPSLAHAAPPALAQPVISDITLSPPGVGAAGGTVTITARIESAVEVASAEVTVAFTTGGTGGGAMTRTAPGADTWEADVVVPPNHSDVAVTHSVLVGAADTEGGSQLADGPSIAQDAVDTSDQPPTIEITDVDPQFLPVGGGSVRIQATAHDDHAISEVYAVVSGPGGPFTVAMAEFSPSDYEGTVVIPANTQPNVVGYTVVGHVVDDQGQEGTDSGPSLGVDPYVEDVEPVTVTDVGTDPPSVAADGGTVTVSATITSPAGIDSAGVSVYLADGGQTGVELLPVSAGSDTYAGDVSIPANSSSEPTSHTFEIQALGNDGGSGGEFGSIEQDGQPVFNDPPSVGIVSIDPTELPAAGGEVQIQATASDDSSIVEVFVTVTGPDGPARVDLAPVSGLLWEGTFTAPPNPSTTDPVVYTTEATAFDDAGASATDTGADITVAAAAEQNPPTITNVSAVPSTVGPEGAPVTISATVTSDAGVQSVSAQVSLAGGGQAGAAMTRTGPGSDVFSGSVAIPANNGFEQLSHSFEVSALGLDGLSASEFGSIEQEGQTVFDQAPDVSITSVEPTELPATGGSVLIRATATDDRNVDSVYVMVSGPSGPLRVDLAPVGGVNWEGTFEAPANPSRFAAVVWTTQATAIDDAGNSNFADGPSITVAPVPNEPPVLTASVSPATLPSAGGEVTITAEASDDVAVADVSADVTAPDGTVSAVALAPTGGTTYEGTFTVPANLTYDPVDHTVAVRATDDEGAGTTHVAGSVTVAARVDQAPVISGATLDPAALTGSGIARIRANVSDDRGLGEVYAAVRGPGGAETRVQMVGTGGTAYEGLLSVPPNTGSTPVAYAVEVVASDRTGHTTRVGAGNLTVAPTPAPVARLKLSDRTLRFGTVSVDATGVRVLTIRNPGSAAVVVDLSVTGRKFELNGPERVRVKPGRKVDLVVQFGPTGVGKKRGELVIERAGGGQPDLTVGLVGRGQPR